MLHHKEPQFAYVVGNSHIYALLHKHHKPQPKHRKLAKLPQLAPSQKQSTLLPHQLGCASSVVKPVTMSMLVPKRLHTPL
jgi:hypothetical protein